MFKFLYKTVLTSFIFLCFIACEESKPNNTPPITSTTEQPISKPILKKAKDCEIKSKILEGNRKIIKEINAIVCIVADSTKESNHRILEVYNTTNCELEKREILPFDLKVDFPYLMADIIYNNNSHLVAIRNHKKVYCYDVDNHNLLDPLIPDFLNERFAVDAQSGNIQHLEVWENYLIGYVQDGGAFVFDVSNTDHPKALLPAAEYDLSFGEGEDFSSLFFLKSENGNTYQAIAPSFDFDNDKFLVNTLFETPQDLNINIPKNIRDNRFIIRRSKDGNTFAIDMEAQKNVALPEQIKTQPTKDILNWLKK